MPNYIAFTQAGSATLDNTNITGNTAVEVHFQTTKQGFQPLFCVISHGDGPNGGFCLFLDANNQLGVSYYHLPMSNVETVRWTPPVSMTDGKWHQAAVCLADGYVTFYVDGNPPTSNGTVQKQALAIPTGIGGNIVLGRVQIPGFTGNFTGNISEVRVWNNAPGFVPSPTTPVGPDAAGLVNYWPFWTNYAAGTNLDVAVSAPSKSAATLVNCSLAYGSDQLIYDPWNEAVLNAAAKPFPALNGPDQASAVTDLLNQLVAGGVIQPAAATLSAFRALYTNPTKMASSALPSAVAAAKPSQSDTTYVQAFSTVQTQLQTEIGIVQSVYEYQSQANSFAQSYYNNANAALNTIKDNDFVPVTATVSADMDDALELAQTLLEFVFALAADAPPKLRALGNEDGDASESGAAALKLMFALTRFLQSNPDANVGYVLNQKLNGTFSQLDQQIIGTYNSCVGNLASNVKVAVQDWGKLSLLSAHSDDFAFAFTATAAVLSSILQAHEVSFAKAILTALYQRWEFPNVAGNTLEAVGMNNMDILNPYFYTFVQSKPGYYNFFAIADFDADPYQVKFTAAPSQTVATFLQNTCGVAATNLMWGWQFTSEIFNPPPGPGAARA